MIIVSSNAPNEHRLADLNRVPKTERSRAPEWTRCRSRPLSSSFLGSREKIFIPEFLVSGRLAGRVLLAKIFTLSQDGPTSQQFW